MRIVPPTLNVVVPCFNAASTIEATLKSLYKELDYYFNLKIIVVNDGSTDCSSEVVRNMQSHMGCINLIEKMNRGVSSARNVGCEYVTRQNRGGYTWFFDSDDLLFSGCGKVLFEILAYDKPDILRFNSVTVDATNVKRIDKFNNYNSSRILFRGKLKDYLTEGIIPFACWSLIFKNKDELSVAFDEALSIGEDVKWNFEFARAYADCQFVYTNLNVVKYMLRNSSTVNTADASTNHRHLDSYIQLYAWLKYSEIGDVPFLRLSYNNSSNTTLNKLITRLLSCQLSDKDNLEYANQIKEWIKQSAYNSIIAKSFRLLSSTSFTLRIAQTCYTHLFLPYIKPHLSRN